MRHLSRWSYGLTAVGLALALILSACGSKGGAESLTALLTGKTFTLETDTSNLEEAIEATCGAELSEGVSTGANEGAVLGLSAQTAEEEEQKVKFTAGHYQITIDGEVVSTGTWVALDGDTIEVTDDEIPDETLTFHVTIRGDELIVRYSQESVDELVNAACSPESTGPTPAESGDVPTPAESDTVDASLAALLHGTWCFESGDPFYLMIAMDTDLDAGAVFATHTATVLTVDENLEERTLGVNEAQGTAWIATGDLGGDNPNLFPYAPIEFLPDEPEAISIHFGTTQTNFEIIGIYGRVSEAVNASCP